MKKAANMRACTARNEWSAQAGRRLARWLVHGPGTGRAGDSRAGFTLVELMAVIIIMAIIMAAGIAGFTNIERGYRLDAAVNQFRNDLSLARQYAIMNNTSVAVLIPTPDAVSSYPYGHADKCLRAYAMYDYGRKRYISGWNYLPEGVVFNYLEDDFPSDMVAPSGVGKIAHHFWRPGSVTVRNISVPFPDDDGPRVGDFLRIQFGSDGSLRMGANMGGLFIPLTDGIIVNWPDQGMLDERDPVQYRPIADRRSAHVVVYNFTGRTDVIRDAE